MKNLILVIGCANMAYVFAKLRYTANHDVLHVHGDEALRLAQTHRGHIALAITESFHPIKSGFDRSVTDNGRTAGARIIAALREMRKETVLMLINPDNQDIIREDDHTFLIDAPDFWKLDPLRDFVEKHLHRFSLAA